jgi:hypothetical protein
MSVDKYRWINTVMADARMTEGERFVLVCIAVRYVLNGDDVFRVKQTTIAERCAISDRTVRAALTHAKELAYLVVSQQRQRGPGHHRADEHRLTLPEIQADMAGYSASELPEDSSGNTTGLPERNDRITGSKCTELPEAATSVTCENVTPNGFIDGSGDGSGPASPFCPDHQPHGTTENCPACGRARVAFQADELARKEAEKTARAAIRAAIDNCNDCDAYGRLDDQSDCPKHPNHRQAA